jgi:lipid-A-disaccharide synthase-like uncharacterized protein
MDSSQAATTLQLIGAGCFGALIGWYIYFINRNRKSDVQLGDLLTLIGVLGGSAVLVLFPARTDLFGAYGIGLAVGFFGYLAMLIILVNISSNFDVDWFLDGRRKKPGPEYEAGPSDRPLPMGAEGTGRTN